MWAGRAECGGSQNGALLSIRGNDRARQSESGGKTNRGRQECAHSLHSYHSLRGLERASSSSRLFAPREIQSRMNFFQRTVISWGRGKRQERERSEHKASQISFLYYKYLKKISSESLTKGTNTWAFKCFSVEQQKGPELYQIVPNLQWLTALTVACKTSASHALSVLRVEGYLLRQQGEDTPVSLVFW